MDSGIKITIIGMIVNLILTIAKIVVGTLSHSLSLVSDGIHSLSDLVTDIIAIISLKISNKPADSDHQYGHGKFDTIASTIIGFILLYAAIVSYFKSRKSRKKLHR
jgi:cation diffusion facilitator family transporter